MMDRSHSYIRALEDFGRKSGRQVNKQVKRYKRQHGIGQYGEPETWLVCIEDKPGSDNFFICYYGSNLEVGTYRTFSGVFLPVDVSAGDRLLLSQSDILDRASAVFKKRQKTGHAAFDRKTTLKTNDILVARKLFSKADIHKEILKSYAEITGLLIGINEIRINEVPELNGRSNISAFIRYDWITNGKQIELLFNLGYLLQSQFSRI